MSEYKIILGQGVNNVSFGDKSEDIIKEFGNPDEINEEVYSDGSITKEFYYNNLDLHFYFDSVEDYKLTGIDFYNSIFSIKNEISIGTEKNQLLKIAENLNFGEPEIEDFETNEDPTHQLISFDKISTNFWLDYDTISSIQISPFWIDDETIKWLK